MRLLEGVQHMGDMRNTQKSWTEDLKEREHSEDLGVDEGKRLE
jgi:hypothetical protein